MLTTLQQFPDYAEVPPTIIPSLSVPACTTPTRTSRPGPPEPTLRLLGAVWIASCPTGWFQLTTARTQQRVERRAAHRVCLICYQGGDV